MSLGVTIILEYPFTATLIIAKANSFSVQKLFGNKTLPNGKNQAIYL